jgi:hypothetical protein
LTATGAFFRAEEAETRVVAVVGGGGVDILSIPPVRHLTGLQVAGAEPKPPIGACYYSLLSLFRSRYYVVGFH